ncbi:MAG: SusC/RagA family TonB-linked outer membrane protein [Dysgonamonadaceae bacterium]|jgi:TonB-linked SusC/RagA family outer membrane protein|nr:SusC/RagA family TonB-linked outer membrane protein [Dysgonamonadaceae bacterium]
MKNFSKFKATGSTKLCCLFFVVCLLSQSENRVLADETPMGGEDFISSQLVNEDALSPADTQQQRRITGKTIDSHGAPLAGVSIRVKGTTIGTASDGEGRFNLALPDRNDQVLVFTYIGMKTREVRLADLSTDILTGRKEYVLSLQEEEQVIDDLVVTGMFDRKAESFTGAARTIKKSELKQVGNTNLFQSLKNLDPSLKIFDNLEMGSDPNTMPDMNLRGVSSFPGETVNTDLKANFQSKPNTPLFIVDGFEASLQEVFDMDMNRIESVTILKDAASKAIYGSKAANGIIVIETIGVGVDGIRVTYTGNLDLEMPDLTSYNLMNAEEKLQAELLQGVYTGYYNPTDYTRMQSYLEKQKRIAEGLDQYWLSIPLRVGAGQKHSVEAQMGTKELQTRLNLTYQNVEGVMKESGRQNLSGTFNISYRKNNVLFRNIASVTSNKSTDSPYGNFAAYTLANPYSPAYDENGKANRYYDTGTTLYASPLYDADLHIIDQTSYLLFSEKLYLEWEISQGFKAIGRMNYTTQRSDADEYFPYNHSTFNTYGINNYSARGSYKLNQGKLNQYSAETLLSYNKTFVEKHNVTFNGSWSIDDKTATEVASKVYGFPSDAMDKYYQNTGGIFYVSGSEKYPSGATTTARNVGFTLATNYTYDERFLFDGTLRRNASSVFGVDNRWATFWSAGLGWNLHNEAFFAPINNTVKLFKIRGSIGYTGNQNLSENRSQASYLFYSDYYNNYWVGSYLNNMENPSLQWEEKKDFNIGFDLDVKGVSVVFDWYRADTKNLVTKVSLPGSTGFKEVNENLGLVRNNGFELSLRVPVIRHSNGFLNLVGNIATNDNKLIELSDAMADFNANQMALAQTKDHVTPVLMYYEGMHMNTIWAVPSLGIDPADGFEVYLDRDGNQTKQWDASNMIAAGIRDSKYNGNFGINGEYKGFGFNVTFTFLGGGQLYNQTLVDKVENADIRFNVDKRVLYGRWQKPGDVVPFRRITESYTYDYDLIATLDVRTEYGKTRATTRFVQDNNELNLSAVSLYYDVNRKWIEKLGFERIRFQANMNDVYKWSTIGIERGTTYPFARTLSLSLTATF